MQPPNKSRARKPAQRQKAPSQEVGTNELIKRLPLSELHFDPLNPRFGGRKFGDKEAGILDEIVRNYGVDDLLHSISSNGYLETEPLVGVRRQEGGVRILEGNRRLAALLILADDPRAVNQSRLREPFHSEQPLFAVPVAVYEESTQPDRFVPYMGVKHIVGPQVWDSFAKAAWMARVLDEPKTPFTIALIEQMIGDTKGTIKRMLEAYYLMEQLEREKKYLPEYSEKKGRGSNAEYPFSWVYNALGYSSIRASLGWSENREPKRNPLTTDRLDRAAKLATYLFGNREKRAAVKESRDIGDLAKCIGDHDKERLLDKGLTVGEVLYEARPGGEKLQESLEDARDSLSDAWNALGKDEVSEEQAEVLRPLAKQVKKKAADVYGQIASKSDGSEE